MSTRWYPLYVKGNPQLRVFLPNFWMKMIEPEKPIPPHKVQFIVSMQMTSEDVKNYLEKIYKVPVVNVRTKVFTGEFKKTNKGYLIKDDDFRKAYVTLESEFKFPDLFPPNKKMEDFDKSQKEQKDEFMKVQEKHKDRQDLPTWFGL